MVRGRSARQRLAAAKAKAEALARAEAKAVVLATTNSKWIQQVKWVQTANS